MASSQKMPNNTGDTATTPIWMSVFSSLSAGSSSVTSAAGAGASSSPASAILRRVLASSSIALLSTETCPSFCNCCIQLPKAVWVNSSKAKRRGVTGFSSCSHLFITCSIDQATSPSWNSPTMRPLPFRVWKLRRMVVMASCCCGSVRSTSIFCSMAASTSTASSR